MKVTILTPTPGEEEEVVIKCHNIDDDLMRLLTRIKNGGGKLTVYKDGEIYLIEPKDVFYFESVEQKVFAYCEAEVYETKSRLYELEELLPPKDFLRISKSSILNLDKIRRITPAFSGRFEALLENGERIIISRQYVSDLKEKLGLKPGGS